MPSGIEPIGDVPAWVLMERRVVERAFRPAFKYSKNPRTEARRPRAFPSPARNQDSAASGGSCRSTHGKNAAVSVT